MNLGVPVVIAMRELGRLLEIYRRPDHFPADVEEMARRYVSVCADVSPDQFSLAVTTYLRSPAKFFPKPGELRELALRERRVFGSAGTLEERYEAWEKAWAEAPLGHPIPCPVCGSIDGWAMQPPTVRRFVWHDAGKHAAARVGFTGPRAQLAGGMAVVPRDAA